MGIVAKIAGGIILASTITGIWNYYDYADRNKSHHITITFSRETTINNPEQLQEAIKILNDNPNYLVFVETHSGITGNAAENIRLSSRRAKAIVNELSGVTNVHSTPDDDIEINRIESEFLGGSKPLPRLDTDTDASYNRRLSRAELYIFYGDRSFSVKEQFLALETGR